MEIVDQLKKLTPTQFENLVFDYCLCLGFENLTWRTPGSDGGRDIEGQVQIISPVSTVRKERWFIECKKYSKSISWPIIYEKIAYAESNHCDVLCLASFPNPSPNCETEISKWNQQRRSIRIETLRAYDFDFRPNNRAIVAAKYGIGAVVHQGYLPQVLQATSGLAQQAYCAEASGTGSTKFLLASSCFADLAEASNECLKHTNASFSLPGFECRHDAFDWQKDCNDSSIPSVFVRALLAVSFLINSKFEGRLSDDTVSVDLGASSTRMLPLGALKEAAIALSIDLTISEREVKGTLKNG